MRLGIKESFTGKTSGKKTSDMILKGDELFTELTEKEFFDGLLQGLEKRGISGTQMPFTGSLGNNQKIDFLRQNIDKTVYIFSHNEGYSKCSFEIYSVFDRVVEYEDFLNDEDLTEEDFNKMKEQDESIAHRVSYLMFGIYDYRVFGAKKDEQDHVQTCVGASNDAEEGVEGLNDLKGWKDMIFARGTENPFNYEDSFFYGNGHFKLNSKFLMEVLKKSAWMKYAAPYWKEYVVDAFGGINGHETLVDFAKHFCRTPKYKPLPVSESFTRKTARKSQEDVTKKADELMFNKVDKYFMFWDTVHSLFLKNKAGNVDSWSFILDVDREVQEDSLCRITRISWDENKDRSNVEGICKGYGLRFCVSRFMDIPFELYGSPFTGKENYYYDKDGNQIRGYRLEIRMETEPVFRGNYGYNRWYSYYTDDMTLEQIPLVGFRIKLRFDVICWDLENGSREYKCTHRGLSNDFRIVPDDKKGFKIVLGKRSPTDKEKVWLVSDTNPNYIFNLMFSVFRSMEDGNFLKMFLEELYRLYKEGPTYSEYIKNPKKYKNFVSVYRERLEYLKNHEPEETMYVETEKLERYLFTELIHHYVDNFPLSESMVRKISKRSADDVINDADDRILTMNSPEFIESIYNWMMEDSEHFQETSIDLYFELTSKETDIENINPKLLRNRKMFFTLRRYPNSEDLLLFVWKIFRVDDKVFIVNFKISHSISNDKNIRDNSVLMCVECRRLGDDSSKYISSYHYFKFDDNYNFVYTPTGKGIDYESRTKYVNRNRLKTVLFNYMMNVKKFIEFWDMLDTIDIRVSELNGTGQGFKRPARKSRVLEIHQEIEGISKKIKRKFRIDVNEKNFYTYTYGKNLAELMLNKVFFT